MLGIGMSELLVILVIILIFVGPQKLPQLVSRLVKVFSELKKEADDLRDTIMKDNDLDS
jgi:sec-independent protein translocase protein TatB